MHKVSPTLALSNRRQDNDTSRLPQMLPSNCLCCHPAIGIRKGQILSFFDRNFYSIQTDCKFRQKFTCRLVKTDFSQPTECKLQTLWSWIFKRVSLIVIIKNPIIKWSKHKALNNYEGINIWYCICDDIV